jgi:GNAT superfamily N-acetyltransferase
VNLRDATVADLGALGALAHASKAHWGYDDAFMRACRDELTVHPVDLERAVVRVAAAEVDRTILGFHGVVPLEGDRVELAWCFVAPPAMGRGVGRALLVDATSIAALAGASVLRIEADPNAEAFYVRHGARRVGDVPSASVPGRALPLLELAIG